MSMYMFTYVLRYSRLVLGSLLYKLYQLQCLCLINLFPLCSIYLRGGHMHQCGKFASRNQEYRARSFGAQADVQYKCVADMHLQIKSTLTSNENIQISISHGTDF